MRYKADIDYGEEGINFVDGATIEAARESAVKWVNERTWPLGQCVLVRVYTSGQSWGSDSANAAPEYLQFYMSPARPRTSNSKECRSADQTKAG
jgi:hypothetical protein